jgi:hypothetical protein
MLSLFLAYSGANPIQLLYFMSIKPDTLAEFVHTSYDGAQNNNSSTRKGLEKWPRTLSLEFLIVALWQSSGRKNPTS